MCVIESGLGELLQPPDLNAFRDWNRQKPKALIDKRMTEAEAISRFVHDGDYLGTGCMARCAARCRWSTRS
jgi:hypothetical protein